MLQRLKRFTNPIDYGLLLALVIPLFAIVPLLTHAGLPNTADGPVHLMRQVELNQAWREGNLYPRWGTDLALGHGMPIFSYAPPALYQLTQLFHLTGLPLDESMKAVLIFDFLLYSLGMFLFARRIFGPYPALVASTVYVYAPYRLREAYIQGNYGQFTGLAFYPLIFWAFHGLVTDGRPRYWIAAALSLAGLLFSHNISFMIFAPIFAVYLLLIAAVTAFRPNSKQGDRSRISHQAVQFSLITARTAAAGLLGLGLAAIFWLPAFGERHDIKLEGITRGFFDFRENFIALAELISPPLPLDLAAINPEFPLSLGLPQIIAAAAGIMALIAFTLRLAGQYKNAVAVAGYDHSSNQRSSDRQKWPRPDLPAARSDPPEISDRYPVCNHLTAFIHLYAHTLFFTIFLLIYIFLTLPQSQILWESVPLIELTEFPWRMLGPAIFCASLLAAAGFALLTINMTGISQNRYPVISALFIGVVLTIIALNAYYLYPTQFISWGTPSPADAFAYEAASGAIGTTSTGEFLPRWAQQHPQPDTLWSDYKAGRPPQKVDLALLPAGATLEVLSHHAESDLVEIDTPEQAELTFRTLYWPGWQLYLDGQPWLFSVTEKTGLIQTTVPAGQHIVELRLESTPLRIIGLWLTRLALVTLFAIAISAGIRKQKNIKQAAAFRYHLPGLDFQAQISPAVSARFFMVTTVLLLSTFAISRLLDPLFTVRSDPNMPQPADQILRVDFEDQIRLVGVDDWPEVIERSDAGEMELEIILYWRALQPLQTNYAVFLHLDAPNGQTLATVDEVNPENIPTRNWPPALYLRNSLRLKIPAELPPVRYQITTGVYHRDTGERLKVESSETTAFSLGWLGLVETQSGLTPAAVATFGSSITLYQPTLAGETLTLRWQTSQPVSRDYSIFVHVLDQHGRLLSQSDGLPYDGLYPIPHWYAGQPVVDPRSLDLSADAHTVAIGIYDPATGRRLSATDLSGNQLPNDTFLMSIIP